MALIVIEGCDRTGKTTLADKLPSLLTKINHRGTKVLHAERPSSQRAVDEYLEPLLSYVPKAGRNLVLDRSFVGESVWPTLFSRSAALTRGEYALLVQAYICRGALFVRCERDLTDLHRAFTEADPPEPLPPALIPAADVLFKQQFAYLEQRGARTTVFDHLTTEPSDIASLAASEENIAPGLASDALPDDLTEAAFAGLIQ